MARSNAVSFAVVADPPLDLAGWEIRVVPSSDFDLRKQRGDDGQPVAVIGRYIELSLSPEISNIGAGSVTLDLDDPFWSTPLLDGSTAMDLLEYEHIWQLWENGALRFEFLGQTESRTIADVNGQRLVTIAGPGLADVLRWGCVMTPYYPNAVPTSGATSDPNVLGYYSFVRVSRMSAWLTLLGDAQKRGTLQFLTPTFTDRIDSAWEPWEDTPAPLPLPGQATSVLQADVNFAVDSSTLTLFAQNLLNNICAQFLAHAAPNVTVVGHTDSTGTNAYNQTLSQNRAQSVATYIRAHVPQAVIAASGKGETQPIAPNTTDAGRAKNRRVTLTYPTGVDASTLYDTPYTPPIGMSLLDLLKELAGEDLEQPSPVRLEWLMHPGFRLDVRRRFGVRRDDQVVFFEGSTNTVSKSLERRRNEIANLIAVQTEWGEYGIATDAASVARWRQREIYSSEGAGYDTEALSGMAGARLEGTKDERTKWTIKVPYKSPGRRLFFDYTLGDWIGISRYRGTTPNTVDRLRVTAFTIRVDANGTEDLELTLESTFDAYARKLQARITSLKYHQKATEVFISDDPPVRAQVGDLWVRKTPES